MRRSGCDGAGEHAGKACVRPGAGARGSTRGGRAQARVCGGGELCALAGDWRAGGRCEQRRVMRGVRGGELAQHAR